MKMNNTGVAPRAEGDSRRRALSRGALLALFFVLSTPAAFSQFTIGRNFTGTSLSQEPGLPGSGGSESIPPDTMGAVGPNNIAEMLNGSFAVYSKTGAVQSHVALKSFWNTAFSNSGAGTTTSSVFDPRILYDPFSNRWYATALDNGGNANSRFLVAVTTDGNPSPANWRGFTIKSDPTSTRWADYDTIGLDASGLFISANMFAISSGSSAVNFVGIPKSSLTAATPSISGMVMQQGVSGSGGSLQTAVDLSNSGLPDPILLASSGHVKRDDVPANFFTSATLSTSGPSIALPSFPSAPQAHQPGSNDISTPATREPRAMSSCKTATFGALTRSALTAERRFNGSRSIGRTMSCSKAA